MASSIVRTNIRQMAGYTPGEQPAVGERVIKLNTNENPFPPSPKVMQALQQIEPEMLRRYPHPTADLFRSAIAKVLDVSREMILAGNGSDDILSIAMRTFLGPDDLLVYPDPTYSLYPVLAEMGLTRHVGVPWAKDFDLPIDGLIASGAKGIFLANPNAPTGTMVSPARIKELLKRYSGLVLVDEAYVDFAGENCVSLVREHENLVISRTLSKAYSLAGLRFGYAIAQPQVIEEMMKVKDSYNCDAISICAATAAVLDQEYARKTWEHVRVERERVTKELTAMGWSVLPSRTNFVLATAPDGDGRSAYLKLKAQGILVRYFDKPGLQDKIRISIGTSQENNALLAGIKAMAAEIAA
ncbi:MAG TPA: histidinol-phosphate transaminase [Tepidisphaeraceae bacterium]|nr:histidinol-phosphate transaminase [Tepidisphaeraceae bacterium]